MTGWPQRLRASGLKVALASNMPLGVKTYVVRRFGWLRDFDWLTFSCDLRVTKPDARIFKHCLEGLGVQPREALFFDDRSENVSGATTLGIAARLFHNAEQAAAELEQLCARRLI
jgi:putative hydrolase of the HAD superfamily